MPALYRLTFLPDGSTRDFCGSRGNYYRLTDGSEIELRSWPVWCVRCGDVTHGERLESVEEIDRKIARLERLADEIRREMSRPPPPAPGARGDRFEREQIGQLRQRRAWRERRRTPPRCLVCGSTGIVSLEGGRAVHAGRGTVVCQIVGMCSTSDNMWYFTSEGERIVDGPNST